MQSVLKGEIIWNFSDLFIWIYWILSKCKLFEAFDSSKHKNL
jgi:hypothetical protein